MTQAFVWFHNGGSDTEGARRFYEGLLAGSPRRAPAG